MRFPNQNNTLIFDRTVEELECFLLFCIVVAGKKASVQVKMLESFLEGSNTPFEFIRQLDRENKLLEQIHKSRLGQYTRLHRCFQELVNSDLDLSTCSVEDLESIHGVGSKTSRFFVVCNRKDARHCVIDTHQLKYMKQYLGWTVPISTPSNKKDYKQLETKWLDYVENIKVNPAEFDLAIWKMYANQDDIDYKRIMDSSKFDIVSV